jgi:predicted HTH domain antitoxin
LVRRHVGGDPFRGKRIATVLEGRLDPILEGEEGVMEKVQVELPEELIRTANISFDHLSQEVAKMIALELFREDSISLGKAAELCSVSVEEFMWFAAQREVPLHYTLQDLECDRKLGASLNQ